MYRGCDYLSLEQDHSKGVKGYSSRAFSGSPNVVKVPIADVQLNGCCGDDVGFFAVGF